MCGFTGFINKVSNFNNINDIIKMTNAINHRGPDDTGIVCYSNIDKSIKEIDVKDSSISFDGFNCAIGFKRLSILDLSKSGHQPMIDYDKKIILAFNGEIYNAFTYKNMLESNGFVFKSRTDTEIIMYLYQLLGFEGMLEKLNGMFAICIVDLNKDITYIARDRMGIKPMYYYYENESFMFGSEVKSFLTNKYFNAKLNTDNLDEYSRFGFITGTDTLLKGVFSIEPGHYISFSNGNLQKHKYWEIYNGEELLDLSFNEAKNLLEEKITESLKLQLLSDVKIGCQLSGGIDSSIITLLTSENLKDYDLNSISIILKDQKYSEEKWIDIVSEKTNVRSHKYQLDSEYFAENFKKAIWHFDFPLLIPNSLGIYMLAEKAKEFFTVFLSGEGADEMFGGYERFHKGIILNNKYIWFILKNIPIFNKRFYNWSSDKSTKYFGADDWYIAVTTQLQPNTLRKIKPDIDFEKSVFKRKEIFNAGNGNFFRKCQRYELKTWLVDLLMRQDKMTMAHSVENRVPFLDHNIVDFARKLPSDYLSRKGYNANKNTKIILKKISEKQFGKEFTYRKKMGFELPLLEFFNNESFHKWVLEVIVPGIEKRGIYSSNIVNDFFKDLSKVSNEQTHMLWFLISFETWAQMYLDNGK